MKMELALYQALISINVPEPKAHAVIEALETDMNTLLATKSDLAQLEMKLTLRTGVMLSAAVGILMAAMKFIH
jgi:hypothetical protein